MHKLKTQILGAVLLGGMFAWPLAGLAEILPDTETELVEPSRIRLTYEHLGHSSGTSSDYFYYPGTAVDKNGYAYSFIGGWRSGSLVARKAAGDGKLLKQWQTDYELNLTAHGAPVVLASGDVYGLVSTNGNYQLWYVPEGDAARFGMRQLDGLPKHGNSRSDRFVTHTMAGGRVVAYRHFIYLDPVVNPKDGNIYGVFGVSQNRGVPASDFNERLFRIHPDGSASTAEIVHDFGQQLDGLNLGHAYSINVDPEGRLVVLIKAWEGESFDDSEIVAVMLRVDPARLAQSDAVTLLHRFTRQEVGQFDLRSTALKNGYLVDGGDGYWYGNSGSLETQLGTTGLLDASNGSIFRIRHDGSGFESLFQFNVSQHLCPADAKPFAPLRDYTTYPEYYEGMPSYGQDGWGVLHRRARQEYMANDACYWHYPKGLMPSGPLVRTEGGIFGTTVYGSVPYDAADGLDRYPGSGLIFMIEPARIGQADNSAYQVVRPFRFAASLGSGEAAEPTGLVAGPAERRADGTEARKLYGTSMKFLGDNRNGTVLYSIDVAGAGIDMWTGGNYWSTERLIVGSRFTLEWEVFATPDVPLHSCRGVAATLRDDDEPEDNRWNVALPLKGSRTLYTSQAGNHRFELVCQTEAGDIYREASLTIPVFSPPVDEEGVLEPIRNGNGSLSAVLLLALPAVVLYRRGRRKLATVMNTTGQ